MTECKRVYIFVHNLGISFYPEKRYTAASKVHTTPVWTSSLTSSYASLAVGINELGIKLYNGNWYSNNAGICLEVPEQ